VLVALADVPAAAGPEAEALLQAIRDAILSMPLPSAVERAVRQLLEQGSLQGRPIAVRSSATAEDSAEASFAGIHESVLNVVGIGPALDAIRRCYASLWTPRAFAYRRRMRIPDDDVLVAPSTDPGWTPLFLRASAVVNVPGALTAIEDGQVLRVDGDAGEVLLSE
jgi:pyruvate,water dikinase